MTPILGTVPFYPIFNPPTAFNNLNASFLTMGKNRKQDKKEKKDKEGSLVLKKTTRTSVLEDAAK
jgi:hypothetical protein